MFANLFTRSGQVTSFRLGRPSAVDNGENGVICSFWQPDSGLLLLAIQMLPQADPTCRETALAIESGGRDGLIGMAAGRRWDRSFLEALTPQAVLMDGEETGDHDSSDIRNRLILSSGDDQPPSERLDFPGLSIDPALRKVEVGGREVELTRREFDLLYFLARHRRQILTRSQLLDRVWGWDCCTDEDTVTVHVSRLRRKLKRNDNGLDPIQTVWGVGYRFEPPAGKVRR